MEVHIYEHALGRKVLAAVCKNAHALADCNNFWVPRVRISYRYASNG
jgi:hypothetical protein